MERNYREEVSAYLRDKYGEEFDITQLSSDADYPVVPNRAYAKPADSEYDFFAVRFDPYKQDGGLEFQDGYGFIFAERAILPTYKKLADEISPDLKLTLRTGNELEVTRESHEKGVSFDEFLDKEKPLSIRVNILTSDGYIDNRENFFEKISQMIAEVPPYEVYYKFQVIFVKEDLFDLYDAERYKSYNLLQFEMQTQEITACTYVEFSGMIAKTDILASLNDHYFSDIQLFERENLVPEGDELDG